MEKTRIEKSAAFCLKDPLFCNRRKADLSPFFDVTPLLPEGGNEREGENRRSMSSWFGVGTNQNWGREAVVERPVTVRTAEHRECPGKV